ncbi:AraC family transcriptional regulator [Rhodococcus sp. JS3073]|uniref:AraC family transcriptional regulator n=1 Tax=Rhodococcus sp. JS3073 TaxID=3002901 RepID=UPI0022863DEA|nr:AraC family transcriptional regulator [Rhodococcus sp. JS3073]WAM13011.1 AraC family transcriptional regulator [Rhodococcus sp. JS3073]
MTMASTITETHDWDAASRAVAGAYFPHTLTDLSSGGAMTLSMRTVDFGPVTLGRLDWGADVSIECDYPGAYEVNIPLSGSLESCSQGDTVVSRPGQATVFRADEPTLISRWSGDCTVLGVKFDSDYLQREADRILGADLRLGLRLPSQIDLTGASESSWFRLVHSLTAQLREPADLLANPVVGPQLAGAITSAFVLAVTPDEEVRGGAPRPRIVKRVLDGLNDDPARAWTAADMAELAGTSVRRLQEGFREYVGRSPSECLLDIRLSRADADLRALEPGVTVSEVAARWGFTHAGRFSAAYRRRYGKSPSELIRF